MPKKTKIEDLKTSTLLDKIDGEENDRVFEEILEEIHNRTPFAYMEERIEELGKEIGNLRKTLKGHAHLNGKVVVEI